MDMPACRRACKWYRSTRKKAQIWCLSRRPTAEELMGAVGDRTLL